MKPGRESKAVYSIEGPPRGEHRRPTFYSRPFRGRLSRNAGSSWPTHREVYLCLGFVQLVLGRFSADLGGFSAGSWRFMVDSRRICIEFSFRLALDSIFAGFGRPGAAKMVPGWSEKWPQRAQEATKKDEKTILTLQSVFGRFPGCVRGSFSSQFGAILRAILEPTSFQNRIKNQ